MYRKSTEYQYVDNGINSKQNKKIEIVIGEPGSKRFRIMNVFIKRDLRDL